MPFAPRRRAALLLALSLHACGGGADERCNVLLISLDSTRRDLLSGYGHVAPHATPDATGHATGHATGATDGARERSSPRLDELAAEGVLFEDAYATTSWTLPSHLSMLTGQPEIVHAVELDDRRLDPARPTLASILAAAGYRTAGFYSAPYLEPHYGFATGFERYEPCYGAELARAAAAARTTRRAVDAAAVGGDRGAWEEAVRRATAAARELEDAAHTDVSSEAVSDALLAELDEAARDGRPFFLFANYFDPHYDYVPPEPFATRFDPAYEGELDGTDFFTSERVSRADPRRRGGRQQVASARDLEHLRALYAGELAWTDFQIGRVLDRLEALGLAERTLVIVTADHGDEFFEHGSLGHRLTLYEEVVQVPMIARLPGVLPAGARVRGLVATMDVVPTVLEVAGVEAPDELVSESFLALGRGEADGSERAVIGRLVHLLPLELPVDGEPEGTDTVRVHLVSVLESYRKGAIKVTRSRSWPELAEPASKELRERIERQALAAKARELVWWIDLERHPDEAEASHSKDFSDPAARSVLAEFHERYAELVRKRGRALPLDDAGNADALRGALRGLGYAGGATGLDADEFLLPPPGLEVLSGAARAPASTEGARGQKPR